jgi:AcrR family transcriptional regulator
MHDVAPVRGAKTRAALVAGARRVFERDGFLDARIADIAAESGVATGSFYTHFASKKEAFVAVIEELHDESLHPNIDVPVSRDDPVDVIRAAHRSYLEIYRRNARLMALLDQVIQIDDDFRELRSKRSREFVDRNAHAIRRLQERGLADKTLDPVMSAAALNGMVSRMASAAFVHGEDIEFEDLVETLTVLWANALGLPRG